MLTVVLWQWDAAKSGYGADRVNAVVKMVDKHYQRPHRTVCITDDPRGIKCETIPLWDDLRNLPGIIPGTWCRLKIFAQGMRELLGPRIVSLDLDCVITGDLAPLWDRPEPFVGWLSAGRRRRPCIYNASMFLLDTEAFPQIWEDFDPRRDPAFLRNLGYIGTEQAWMSYCLGDAQAAWTWRDGAYSYRYQIRKTGKLPDNARIVFFHGPTKPWSMPSAWMRDVHTRGAEDIGEARDAWIKEHYTCTT